MEPRFNIILDDEIEQLIRKVMVRRLESGVPATLINKSVLMREALREGLGIQLAGRVTPKFNSPASFDPVLLCPICGETNLHHRKVEVFGRQQEDSQSGVHVVLDGATAKIDSSMSGNPSGRRDGVAIMFWCEHCDNETLLTLSQHKGSTYVNFGGE